MTATASAAAAPCSPAWESSLAYTAGADVSHGGKNYEAAWWSQGLTPTGQLPWKNLGACSPAPVIPAGCFTPWTAYVQYNANTKVTHGQRNYQAALYSEAVVPGTSGAHWQDIGACGGGGGNPNPQPSAVMFDDFSYSSRNDPQLTNDRWVLRTGGGGPGLDGVSWSPNNISFQDRDGQRVLKLDVTSSGQAANTVQAQITTADRKFREGTYGARVKFSDAPMYGPDGDHVVQAFFSITPLRYDYDPEYGELDFEYLPNGGWAAPQAFYVTSWETYRPEPWDALKDYDMMTRSYAGWHDLVVTLDATSAVYYIDGVEVGRHHAPNLPKSDQTIDFNHWLINDGVLPTSQARGYEQLVDWVYFAEGETLSPSQVQSQVNTLRSTGVAFRDNVPD